jgi:hypothetical protein
MEIRRALAPILLIASLVAPTAADAQEPEIGVRGTLEVGFLGVLAHEITLGRDGTRINYVTDGGQSNLYFLPRLQAEIDIWRQHRVTFLYQPLDLVSTSVVGRDLRIDRLDFPAQTPMEFRYGFSFYRLGWSYDVLDDPNDELSFGLALQLRNANITFESLDGTLFRDRRDVGPVPLLRFNGRFAFATSWFFGWELDGFYAPISVLNGSGTNDVVGAIADASVRVGVRLVPHVDVFANVRYIGGGASGAGSPSDTSDGYQSNWLHFLNISLGVTIDSRPGNGMMGFDGSLLAPASAAAAPLTTEPAASEPASSEPAAAPASGDSAAPANDNTSASGA